MTIIDLFRYAEELRFISIDFSYDSESDCYILHLDSTEPPYEQYEIIINSSVTNMNDRIMEAYEIMKSIEGAINEC